MSAAGAHRLFTAVRVPPCSPVHLRHLVLTITTRDLARECDVFAMDARLSRLARRPALTPAPFRPLSDTRNRLIVCASAAHATICALIDLVHAASLEFTSCRPLQLRPRVPALTCSSYHLCIRLAVQIWYTRRLSNRTLRCCHNYNGLFPIR